MRNRINLLKEFDNVVKKEMSGTGAVGGYEAGYQWLKKDKPMAEYQEPEERQNTKVYNGRNVKVSRSYRGDNKGYTVLIIDTKNKGVKFEDDRIMQRIVEFADKII